jgi:hypothetical protein
MSDINSIIVFLKENYQWVFSGIGIPVIGWFFLKKPSSENKVRMKNIKASGDVVGRDKRR